MLSIMICEDEDEDLQQLERASSACRMLHGVDYKVESFRNARHLLLNYDPAEYDILFFDILMEEENGIELAQQIRKKNAEVPIVFVTSSLDFAIESYKVNAVHYLLKPVTAEAVDEALARCKHILSSNHRTIEISVRRMTQRVLVNDILYVEASGHHVTLHMRDRNIETTTPLSKILEDVGKSFLRCHRSFAVNMDHIAYTHGKSFHMIDDTDVPIRSNGSAQVVEDYHTYLFKSARDL